MHFEGPSGTLVQNAPKRLLFSIFELWGSLGLFEAPWAASKTCPWRGAPQSFPGVNLGALGLPGAFWCSLGDLQGPQGEAPWNSPGLPGGFPGLPRRFPGALGRSPDVSLGLPGSSPEAPRGSPEVPRKLPGATRTSRRLPEAPRMHFEGPSGALVQNALKGPRGLSGAPWKLPEASRSFPEAPRSSYRLLGAPRKLPEASRSSPEAPGAPRVLAKFGALKRCPCVTGVNFGALKRCPCLTGADFGCLRRCPCLRSGLGFTPRAKLIFESQTRNNTKIMLLLQISR